jgi:hypothetical protein
VVIVAWKRMRMKRRAGMWEGCGRREPLGMGCGSCEWERARTTLEERKKRERERESCGENIHIGSKRECTCF